MLDWTGVKIVLGNLRPTGVAERMLTELPLYRLRLEDVSRHLCLAVPADVTYNNANRNQ